MLLATCILCLVLISSLSPLAATAAAAATPQDTFNLTLPHQHPHPEAVVQQLQRRLNVSLSATRRQMLGIQTQTNDQSSSSSCLTGNPIDDCWRCDPNWAADRQRLADCGIGFGQAALGGKGGQIYTVTDNSDDDPVSPKPGTLRHAVIQAEPLWIVFSGDMLIKLRYELIMNSYKTIDGRGANVHVVGGGCITVQYISNVIIHNIHVHHCLPTGNTNVRSTPSHYGHRGKSDGDGISIFGSHDIWIDHCSLSHCSDGLIDAVMGSTAITISNNYFAHHNEVMLLGHSDDYGPDSGMQVTIAFNHFGEGLVQRMPRCRRGYIHVVNNDFTQWEMYAIGGSAGPTINSQGNRYTAPTDPDAKEVTKRVDIPDKKDWAGWNWRSDGDELLNGAFFVPSGLYLSSMYAKAESVEPKSSTFVDQLTINAGPLGNSKDNNGVPGYKDGLGTGKSSSSGSGNIEDFFAMLFQNGGPKTASPSTMATFTALLTLLILCRTTLPVPGNNVWLL